MESLRAHLFDKAHVIWDWNGTLLDDTDMVIEVMGKILADHGLPPLTRERYAEVFGFPVSDYYRKLGFDFEKTPFEVLSDRFITGYLAGVPRCRLHPGMKELIAELKEAGIRQSVLSAAHEGPLREQLRHFEIHDFLDGIYGLTNHHAASKVDRGLALLAESGIAPSQTILVGDTDHDYEVALALGVHVVLLGDGHQAPERLRRLHPHVLGNRYAAL